MSFVDAVRSVYGNYFNFSGRARRREYWWFFLFVYAIGFVVSMVAVAAGLRSTFTTVAYGALGIFYLVNFIPSLAVTVRRLHDTDHSGWWLLLAFIPLIGGIILLIWFFTDGTRGPNNYGPDPKGRGPSGYGQPYPQQWGPPGQPPPGQPPSW